MKRVSPEPVADPRPLAIDDVTVHPDEVFYVPSGETLGVLDLDVKAGGTFIADGEVEVFGDLIGGGSIAGSGSLTDLTL